MYLAAASALGKCEERTSRGSQKTQSPELAALLAFGACVAEGVRGRLKDE